jgi:hypothetical protein
MNQVHALKLTSKTPRASGSKKSKATPPVATALEVTKTEEQAPALEVKQETAPEVAAPEVTDEIKVGPVKFMRNPMNGYLSGARLLSHTVAFIKATTGGVPGVAMPQFRTVVGASALSYHKAKGNLAIGDTGAPVLTEQGSQFFAVRPGNEASLIATFENMFHTGELPSGMIGERHAPIRIAK